jgi:SET domain-containing protein
MRKLSIKIINGKIHRCLEIPDLFLVLNMISHLFASLTLEISCSTLEINLVFPCTHVLLSNYNIGCNIDFSVKISIDHHTINYL